MPDTQSARRRFQFCLRTLLVVVALCAVPFLFFGGPVQREMGWIDAVTASTKQQTYVTFGFEMPPLILTTPVIKPSPLADWLARQEGTVTYDWRHVNGTLKTIWGTSVGWGHGSAPPMYFFSRDLLERFVKSSSDNELRHFVDVIRHGTEPEQKAAVEAAVNKELDAMCQETANRRESRIHKRSTWKAAYPVVSAKTNAHVRPPRSDDRASGLRNHRACAKWVDRTLSRLLTALQKAVCGLSGTASGGAIGRRRAPQIVPTGTRSY